MSVSKEEGRAREREKGEGEESKRSSREPMTAEGEISENLLYDSASRSASTSWWKEPANIKATFFESLLQMKQSREISGTAEAGTSCITFVQESPSSFLGYAHKEEEKGEFPVVT